MIELAEVESRVNELLEDQVVSEYYFFIKKSRKSKVHRGFGDMVKDISVKQKISIERAVVIVQGAVNRASRN